MTAFCSGPPARVFRPITMSGLFVVSDRSKSARVDLPHPFSPKTSVHGPNVVLATDRPFSKHPTFRTYLTSFSGISAGVAAAPGTASDSTVPPISVTSLIAHPFGSSLLSLPPGQLFDSLYFDGSRIRVTQALYELKPRADESAAARFPCLPPSSFRKSIYARQTLMTCPHERVLCLLFIHPRVPNLIDLRSTSTMPA